MAADHERGLVVRAREDAAAFAELYDFYMPRVYGFVYRRVQDRCVAEDITSMTFQRALENIRDRRFVAIGDPESMGEPNAVAIDALAAALDRDQLRRALLNLSNGHREVLLLRFYDDMDTPEICTVLGCSRETFAVRLHRALRALRLALAKESADVA
jgi:RNA polymerase sigma-70 factor (ECF subfamily)